LTTAAGGGALVITGALLTVIVNGPAFALGNVPFAATTENVYAPAVVGVPESAPDDERFKPGGKVPALARLQVMGVVPLA
jgi:hypothetical protein